MALETGTYISDLVATNPASGDNVSTADDHLRLIKSTVKATFPNVSGAVNATHTELNYVDGVTSAIQTQLDAKLGSSDTATLTNKTINLSSNTLTGTTAQFNTALSDDNFATLTGTETLTNKTLTGYTETVYAVSGTTPALSPANGTIQTWTLSANSTPTAGTWASGQGMTVMLTPGAYTVTWTSLPVTWKTGGGSAPAATVTTIVLAKIGSTIYGWAAGNA